MMFWGHNRRQKELKIVHSLHHCHVKWAHQRSPFIKHLPGRLNRKINPAVANEILKYGFQVLWDELQAMVLIPIVNRAFYENVKRAPGKLKVIPVQEFSLPKTCRIKVKTKIQLNSVQLS